MARDPIETTQVDAKSPIDEQLMLLSLKANDDDHETRILGLEAGGGSSGAALDDPRIGRALSGFDDNTGEFIRHRFSAQSNYISESPDSLNAYDPFGEDAKELTLSPGVFGEITTTAFSTNAEGYLGKILSLTKSDKLYFKKKKGLNFFGLIYTDNTTLSDSITIKIDGVAVNTYGSVDENGVAHGATFSSGTTGTNKFQFGKWFFRIRP